MGNGYTSWTCEDLGGATLYSSDVIWNPDSIANGYFCPLVRPYGFNIMALYEADIYAAREAQQDYDSGVIRIGRRYDGGSLLNYYMIMRIMYRYSATLGADRIVVKIGTLYNNHEVYDKTIEIDRDNYSTYPEFRKCIYIYRLLNRSSYHYADLPGYEGTYQYYFCFGADTKIYLGTWEEPSTSYPHGRMVYTNNGYMDPAYCLLSTPCADDNTESRYEQSEAIIRTLDYAYIYSNNPDFYIGDYEGHYDGNPEPPHKKDPNTEDPDGPSGPGGGDGDHRPTFTPIPIPGLPTIGPNSAGFVYMLRLDVTQMNQFAIDLVRPSWWTALKNFFADPLDFICGIMIVPYSPVSNYSVYPKFGDNIFEHAYPQVYQQYTEIDCGRLAVNKYFGSCFDNNPYTELLIWLPYIGYRKLDPDEVVGKTLHVVYHCDCLTGDCVCYISTEAGHGSDPVFARVVAQFSGNCGVRVPFGAQSYDAAVAASVQLLGGAVGAIAGGATGAAIAAGNITASQISNSIAGSTVSAVNGSKVVTERSGTAGASAGYLSVQTPYLLRTIPRQSLPTNYQELEGYPSNIAGPLSNFYGFAAVETINLNNLSASQAEIDEIKRLLVGGVYI